jgi:succinate dehydrogenase/fumarate reductase cytochrome b subunit
MTKGEKPDWALVLHTDALADVLLIVCVVFHASYGLRTICVDLGLRKDELLFWVFTLLGLAVSVLLLAIYFTRGA